VKKGRVISQSPPPHWRREHGAKINFVLSKGRR
jgi:beta-lactam-binding protein with PASTA domain